MDKLSPKEQARITTALRLGREQEGREMTTLESKLCALLDRIEVEEDHTLATQRFDLYEEAGYTVVFSGMDVGSGGKVN